VSFLEPLYLAGLLAAAVPVIIHLINRRKAVHQPFPALKLLRESDEKEARSLKVRQWLLMALRVLAVALLVMALAKPYLLSDASADRGGRLPSSVVFVVDDSMSMHYGDWWSRATERLDRELGALKTWDEAALITTNRIEGPVGRLTSDKARLKTAADELEAGQTTGNLPEALLRAGDILSTSELPNRRIVVISDFTAGGFPTSAGDAAVEYPIQQISVRDDGASPTNLAVTGVSYSQQGPAREGRWVIRAQVKNYADRVVDDVEVDLRVEDRVVASRVVPTLKAGGTTTVSVTHTVKGAGLRRGVVEIGNAEALGDRLALDNQRHFTFRMKKNVEVLLVNGAPSSVAYRDELYFAVRALNPGQTSESSLVPTVVTPGGLADKKLENFDVVLMANVARLEQSGAEQLRTFVRNGGGLFVAMGDQVEVDNYNERLTSLLPKPLRRIKRLTSRDDPDAPVKVTRMGASKRTHPVFRVFDMPGGQALQSARVYKYMLLEPTTPEASTVLLNYRDGAPALLERRVERGRVFLLTTTIDRAWTDLPLRTAFLPMMRRSMLYLARRATSEGTERYLVGDTIKLDVTGLADRRVVVTGPDSLRFVLEPKDGLATVEPPRAGAYTVWSGDGAEADANGESNRLDGLAFSVNVPLKESNLTPLSDGALDPWIERGDDQGSKGQDSATSARAAAVDRVNLWPALLFAVTLALLLETLVGTRRSVLRRIWRRLTLQDEPEVEV
jgi:hypothetical protein